MRRILPLSRINYSLSSDWSLDDTQVETVRIQYGTNDIIETHSNQWIALAIDTAKDPMIWFLIATAILFAILKNYNQAIILMIATVPLIGMDAFLHWRTQVSTQSLSSRLAAKALVIRNGIESELSAWEIVPGDLVVVPTGMPFPADGIVIAGKDIQVDESALTGESFPVKKMSLNTFQENKTEVTVDSDHWGFAGTRLLTGRALLRIVYTGKKTLYGEIVTSALNTTQARTPLQKAIAKLVFILIIAAIALCFVLAGVRYYQGFGIIDSILSAATLAVAALPDEFPVVFTFFLGVGVYRLAKKKALVRRAVSVENIGRVTCICSDKTGTITEGHFQLVRFLPDHSLDNEKLLYLAAVASRTESGDLIDLAIFDEIQKNKITIPERIKTIPFTEDRKRETSIIKVNSQEYLIATKGAPETILSISTLTPIEKESWLQRITELAYSGYKIIACAQRVSETTPAEEPQLDYQFTGLLAFTDPPRAGVADAINTCKASQIHVLMITGDHPETARAIAREIGLGNGNPNVILAEDAESLLQKNNSQYLRSIDVIARAIPSQKLNIVTTLQLSGEIVAVTGDGVNDVPALKASDVGISMGERGTQSAREASDIILLDDNFDSIVNAISEGRQLFKNLQLSFKYLLIIHMPFVLSAAIIPMFGYPLLYYPIHIVFIELIIHPTAMLVFQDLPQSKNLAIAETKNKIYFFTNKDWSTLLITGLFLTAVVILSFIFIYDQNLNTEHARAFVLAELGFTSATLTLGLSGFKTRVAQIVIMATVLFTILLIQVSIISNFFSLTPLNLHDWLAVMITSFITYILIKIKGYQQK
ncbi:MAG: cation-transporting P-type ATPase [Gammaproteobacteria bacterium]|nr:cation-transporting P-type ATPase [Gammaproteobacteria bacterium]